MYEIIQATEVSADLNDIDVSDLDFGRIDEDAAEEAAPEDESADQQEATEGEAGAEESKAEEAKEETDQFTLKHLDEVKTVSRDEVVILAQKGMDYDRLKQKSEERYAALEVEKSLLDSRVAIFNEMAKSGGYKDVDELIDNIQAEQLSERTGIEKSAALTQVRLERKEKELAEKERRLTATKDSKNKVEEDARAFVEKHPDINFKSIPKEVWDRVNAGESLLSAYDEHMMDSQRKELAAENERLKAELEAAKKNADNKARSTGSATSAGKDSISDPWISDLESRF